MFFISNNLAPPFLPVEKVRTALRIPAQLFPLAPTFVQRAPSSASEVTLNEYKNGVGKAQ